MGHRAAEQEKMTSAPASSHKRLSARNRALLAFLEELKATPDDMGEEWWAEFEKELRENRFAIRRESEPVAPAACRLTQSRASSTSDGC